MGKVVKSDWALIREAEELGLSVSMDRVVERNRTELNKELSTYFLSKFPKFNGSYDENEGEEVLEAINEYIKDIEIRKYRLEFPYSAGSELYLIPVTENVSFKVIIVDEYYGGGDYEKYVMIDRFIINENTNTDDIDKMIAVFAKYGIK